jgi:hypothetical protein
MLIIAMLVRGRARAGPTIADASASAGAPQVSLSLATSAGVLIVAKQEALRMC